MSNLEWIDGRWHLDGRGIHAGCVIEIRWPDGYWEAVRIESGDAGRRLYAQVEYHGVELGIRVDDAAGCEMRWRHA